ncbi:hemagglutinin repeat-containing protein [Terasakiella sp. SH-1]|uniref:hemagglutinin repeat-containing protein n=1 Tax=Terasakiella sp. SH-1 TaxID=2560057 RepID=UPI0010740E0F|nr:hemagglutinin repeat-containing protein [Terasakiella sp. SH-1]
MKQLLKKTLCWTLSLTIALQPNMVQAQSATITVDPSMPTASVSTTINDTPLLDIVAPNGSGVSHNKFTDFNVGKSGLVVNNSTIDTLTKTGGAIFANPNFSGTAASLIINEVTSANRSSLTGFTEIAGQKADYILANPNGITCNGCGFINTSRSTLTTGTPVFSGTSLDSLSVNGGDVVVNSLGLNANDADAFDIITRAAEISGAINAKELNIIAGRNDVQYSDRSVTKKTDDGSTKPTLAIDSSALGGMYAGRIALIANETGVGVNMQGEMAASTSELTITADGKIELKKASAATGLTITAQNSNDVTASSTLYAGDDLAISAGGTATLSSATLSTKDDVTVSAATITASNATITAGRNSDGSNATTGDLSLTATNSLSFEGSTLQAVETATLSADQISDGSASGGITATGAISITGTTSTTLTGNVQSNSNVSLSGAAITAKNITAGGTATINATNTANLSGHLQSTSTASLTGQTISTNQITTGGDITLTATTQATLSGKTQSNAALNLTAPTLSTAELEAVGNLTLEGSTRATTSGNITAGGTFSLTGGALTTGSGTGDITGTATINGASYSGSNALEATGNITVTTTGDTTLNTGGSLTSSGSVSVTSSGGNITSDGTISSQTGTTLTANQALTTTANSQTQSADDTTITAGTTLTNGGLMTATNDLTLTALHLINSGTISDGSSDGFELNITGDLTNTGLLYSSGSLTLATPGTLTNEEGNILANGNIQIDSNGSGGKNTKVYNLSGNIESLNGGISIYTNNLTNERKGASSPTPKTISSSSSTKTTKTNYYRGSDSHPSCGVVGTCSLTRTTSSSSVIEKTTSYTGDPAKLISSLAMTLDATNLTNKGGYIATNNDLTLKGNTLTNEGQATIRTTSSSSKTVKIIAYVDAETGSMPSSKSTSSSSSTSSTVIEAGDTFITAGGNITGPFTGSIDNISMFGGADPVSITAGSANVHATSADIGLPTTASINANISLPSGPGGLFVQTTNPTANYIIEVNPAVATLGALYGSDYFTQKMGFNLAGEVKRLGNNDWETRQVRDQIMAVTHNRFLSPTITNDNDQYLALMDAALAQQEDLQLSYGVALSSKQIASLTQDMVWMVEVELEDGRKALKPVVYLAEATRMKIDSSGAIIHAEGDLNLTAGGDITNSGTLSGANTTIASSAGSLTNTYGKLEAANGNLNVSTDQDITNTGGLLTGENVTLSATNGNFTNTTETWQQSSATLHDNYDRRRDVNIGRSIVSGSQARVQATGGNLTITSGQDITDTGGKLTSTGDATLKAGGDITLKALKTVNKSYDRDRHGRYAGVSTTQEAYQTSEIHAGGALNLNSAQQTVMQGSTLQAGTDLTITSGTDTVMTAVQNTKAVDSASIGMNGQLGRWSTQVNNDLASLKAGNDLTITSGENTTAKGTTLVAGNDLSIDSGATTTLTGVQDTYKQDIVGEKYELHIDNRTTVSARAIAGSDLSIKSGEDITVAGSTLSAGKSATLEADNNIAIAGMQDMKYRMERTSKSGMLSSSSTTNTSYNENTVSSSITAGENVTIRAANDTTLQATNVRARDNLSLSAEQSLTITSAEDKSHSSSVTTKSFGINLGVASYNSMKGTASSNGETTTVTSTLSGDNVSISSGADLNIKGSQIEAETDASLNAGGKLNIEHASNTKESSSSSFKSKSMSVTIPGLSIGYNSAQTQTDSVYDQTVVAATLKSGNDLNVNVGADAAITGSELEAGGDLNMTVGGDLNLATAQNVHQETHSQTSSKGFNIGVSFANVGVNVAQTKIKGSEQSALDVINEGTVLKADQNLNVSADNISIVSGELSSGTDTTLSATNDIAMTTAQDIHQTSSSTLTGKTTSVGVSYGGQTEGGDTNYSVGMTASKGKFTTNTTTQTDTLQQGTEITAGNDINITSGKDTTLVNAELTAGDSTTIEAGGDVNLLAAADTHATTNSTSTTKTSSVGVNVGASLNYDNGGPDSTFGSKDGKFTTGTLGVGVTQTKSKSSTTSTTTTQTVHQGTTIRSGDGTTVTAANDATVENTETTGQVLQDGDTLTAGDTVTETTLTNTVKTVTTSTSSSSSSSSLSGPDLKQFVLDSVANAVGEIGANKIGDMKAGEKNEDGTQEEGIDEGTHKILHAANGAIEGFIRSGGDLDAAGAGAIGAVVGEVTAEVAGDLISKDDEDRNQKITYAATTAALIAANLLGQDSDIAMQAASNAVKNNRMLHTTEILAVEKTAEQMAKTKGGTKEEWVTRLGNEALRQVDAEMSREIAQDSEALAILKTMDNYGKGFTDNLGNQLKFLSEDNQFNNPSLFASTVMANKSFYDVVLKDFAPTGFENLKGVLPGSTLGMANALQEIHKSSNVVGGGTELNLTDQEKINRTFELVETSKQIYLVKQELKNAKQKTLTSDQKSELFLLNDGLELTKTKVMGGITQTMQTGFNKGAAKFVVENAEALGLLLYDVSTPAMLLDVDSATRNQERVEGITYLITHLDELPEQIANDFKTTMADAKEKLDAGDHVGGMEIYGELTAALGSTALGGLKLTTEVAGAIGKIRKNERLLWGNWNDYPKITKTGPNGPQEYAKIGDRLYSQHAVARMQPSGQRYSSGAPAEGQPQPVTGDRLPYINQPGINYFDGTDNIRGRSISPNHVEDIIQNTTPVKQANGNLRYSSGSIDVITSSEGRVVTIKPIGGK